MKVYERKMRIPIDSGMTDSIICRELVHSLISGIPDDELMRIFNYSNHKVLHPLDELQHEITIYL